MNCDQPSSIMPSPLGRRQLYRFGLRSLAVGVAFCGVLFSWAHLIVYASHCESFFAPVGQLRSPINPASTHDRLLLEAPNGSVYQRPYDPVTLGTFFLFTISLGMAFTISELTRGADSPRSPNPVNDFEPRFPAKS